MNSEHTHCFQYFLEEFKSKIYMVCLVCDSTLTLPRLNRIKSNLTADVWAYDASNDIKNPSLMHCATQRMIHILNACAAHHFSFQFFNAEKSIRDILMVKFKLTTTTTTATT